MTPRQKEFIRHYLAGAPAPEAAVAAGYARSTAEANAKAILSSKAVAAKLTELRIRAQEPHRQAIAQAMTELQNILATEQDTRLKLIAIRELRACCRQLERLGPPATLVNEILGEPEENTNENDQETFVGNSWKTDENNPQRADAEDDNEEINKSIKTESQPQIPETDTLPDDTPAADTRLAPRKPAPPKRPPTVITFRLPEKAQLPTPIS